MYSTLFGGSGVDQPFQILVSPVLDVVILGQTSSRNFPSVPSYPVTLNGPSDAFFAYFQSNRLLYSNPTLLQTGLSGGSADDLFFTGAPMWGPGGGFFGLRLFGQTDSMIPSSLKGFGDCNAKGSLFLGDVTFFTPSPRLGCLGPGFFEASTLAPNGDIFLLADVISSVVPPTTPFQYSGGSDSLLLQKRGFDDP